jgi:hypothetical protein
MLVCEQWSEEGKVDKADNNRIKAETKYPLKFE